MTAIPLERPLAIAVKAALEVAIGTGLVGDAVKPADGGQTSTKFVGYAVLYPGRTGGATGPATGTSVDARQSWQVTYVGIDADQAARIRDKGRLAMLGVALTVSGRFCSLVELDESQETRRDDDVAPPLFYAVDRYSTTTSPA